MPAYLSCRQARISEESGSLVLSGKSDLTKRTCILGIDGKV